MQGEQPVPARGAEPVGAGNEGGAVPSDVQGGTTNGDNEQAQSVNSFDALPSEGDLSAADGVAQEEIGQPVGISEQLENGGQNALQNGANELNLQQENEQNNVDETNISRGGQVSQSVPQGEHGTQTPQIGGMEETAARLGERIEADGGTPQSGLSRDVREIENRVTREYAQENGLWIPFDDVYRLGVPAISGNEHNNYLDEVNQRINKVNNRMNTPSILDLLDRMELHNKYFPESKYSLIGFTAVSDNGDVWPVFAQDYVSGARVATNEEIDAYMSALGFTPMGNGRYTNGEIVAKDLHPRNVLADADGDIYVVDAEFEPAEIAENGGEKKSSIIEEAEAEYRNNPLHGVQFSIDADAYNNEDVTFGESEQSTEGGALVSYQDVIYKGQTIGWVKETQSGRMFAPMVTSFYVPLENATEEDKRSPHYFEGEGIICASRHCSRWLTISMASQNRAKSKSRDTRRRFLTTATSS